MNFGASKFAQKNNTFGLNDVGCTPETDRHNRDNRCSMRPFFRSKGIWLLPARTVMASIETTVNVTGNDSSSTLNVIAKRSETTDMTKIRFALLGLTAAATFATAANDVSAGDFTDLFRAPVRMVSPLIPLDVSTAVPTTRELMAVPTPSSQRLTEYPVDVARYGLNVYPSARILRQNGLMPFSF